MDLRKVGPDLRWFGEHTLAAIFTLAGFWIAAKVVECFICRLRHRMPHNASLLQLLGRTIKIAIMVPGAASAVGTMGVNVFRPRRRPGADRVCARIRISRCPIQPASRHIVAMLLFMPFGIGDRISVSGLEGEAIEIDLRYTVLRQPDKKR